MPALVLDPLPPALEQFLAERARLDLDRRDEVWEGVLHVIPPASHEHERLVSLLHWLLYPVARDAGLELTGSVGIGAGTESYRVPDLAIHHPGAAAQWHPTAAIAVEIISPGDETWKKLPFYATHHVQELLIIDPAQHQVHWYTLQDNGEYRTIEHSQVINLSAADLADRIDWPA